MLIGGSNNNPVAGINLTSAELARIVTSSGGMVTIGDPNQTGNITLSTATPAATAGATTSIVQSTTGAGQVILDDGSGTGTALNANNGAVEISAGTGGIVEQNTNTAGTPDIGGGASAVLLDSAGSVGSSGQPLQVNASILSTNAVTGVFLASTISALALSNSTGNISVTNAEPPRQVAGRASIQAGKRRSHYREHRATGNGIRLPISQFQ